MSSDRLVPGVDTRAANATPTVRYASHAATLVAGPAILVALVAPSYWRSWVAVPAASLPWITVALLVAGIATSSFAWRARPALPGTGGRVMPGGAEAVLILVLLAVFALSDNERLRAAALVPVAPVAGWAMGRAARLAADAVPPKIRSAAAGLVTAKALAGLVIAGHLSLVLSGSGPRRAAGWSLFYLSLAFVMLVRAGRAYAPDRVRTEARLAVAKAETPKHLALFVDGASVTFGSTRVLQGTTLSARAGEVVALVGGNGAGKSTLLRVAAGLLVPEAGTVSIAGEDVTELVPEERAVAGVAFVSGARPVFPDLTVMQNLRVAAFRTHLTNRSFATATDAVFDLLPRLADRRDVKAGVLSGGEQRLLALAQTMYRVPKVLLADELALGLDVDARLAVFDLLRTLADQDVAVVVVDHDLLSLLPRADRASLLSGGTITDHTPALDVLDTHAGLLEATFLAEAAR